MNAEDDKLRRSKQAFTSKHKADRNSPIPPLTSRSILFWGTCRVDGCHIRSRAVFAQGCDDSS